MTIDETEVIFRCRFGSHLYGTNTPESDYDEKGIFIETLENIILRRDSRSLHFNTGNDRSRNTKNDCDIELKELRTFLKEAMDGQTYALDMLFLQRTKHADNIRDVEIHSRKPQQTHFEKRQALHWILPSAMRQIRP